MSTLALVCLSYSFTVTSYNLDNHSKNDNFAESAVLAFAEQRAGHGEIQHKKLPVLRKSAAWKHFRFAYIVNTFADIQSIPF